MRSRTRRPCWDRALVVAWGLAVGLFAASCSSGPAASPPGTRPVAAPCSVRPMVAALQRSYGNSVKIIYHGHLVCAGNLAEISVMVASRAATKPGYSGPVGSPHGALMHYRAGAWHEVDLAKPNPYCTADGHQTSAVPRRLGVVCGIQ